jgi:hypothetical protein
VVAAPQSLGSPAPVYTSKLKANKRERATHFSVHRSADVSRGAAATGGGAAAAAAAGRLDAPLAEPTAPAPVGMSSSCSFNEPTSGCFERSGSSSEFRIRWSSPFSSKRSMSCLDASSALSFDAPAPSPMMA